MNKKVFVTMLILALSFLLGIYVVKIFFPEQFMLVIQNEQLVKMGQYVDTHEWLRWVCRYVTAFITYWLFCCACSRRLYLKWYECLYILLGITAVRMVALFDTNLSSIISVLSFVILPALTKGTLTNCAIVYTVHGLAQGLSLTIRNLTIYLRSANYITILAMGIESYFWLILLYVIFNYKTKEKMQ